MGNLNRKKLVYEIVFASLALIAVILAIMDLLGKIPPGYHYAYLAVDAIIWLIFVVDYIVGLIKSESKGQYIKTHIWDLLSLIPLDSLFRAFRLFRLIRIAFLFKRFSSKASAFLRLNGFIYMLYFTVSCIFLGAVLIYFFEHGTTINSFSDAVWWSFVTTTTVGYGDISPASGCGRFVAAILMIVGIGFISMLTGTIATFFVRRTGSDKDSDADILTDEEREELENYKRYIISKRDRND